MEVVYYYDESRRISPVKRYLERYVITKTDSIKVRAWKMNTLTEIDKRIKYIAGFNGKPIPPIAVPLHDYSFFEIKTRKNKSVLIRIIYFCHKETMIILSAFEKPAHYDKNKERREIIKQYTLADNFRIKYINIQTYETY